MLKVDGQRRRTNRKGGRGVLSLRRLLVLMTLGAAFAGLRAGAALAVPSFAQQTGQPCSACHVGAFGPQLKPYARDFKLFGYQASDNKSHELPIAVAAMTSFTRTEKPQEPDAAPHFGANDNVSVDQASVFYAGKAPLGLGVFAQVTYDGVGETLVLDNVDVRKTWPIDVGGKDLVVGVDVNNNPGVQDAWNSAPAWRFPYSSSALAPYPEAAALIDGGLGGLSAGVGAYAFFDYSLYGEVTLYKGLDPVFAGRLGEGSNSQSDVYPGVIPYWRFALAHDYGSGSSIEIGTMGLEAERYPGGDSAFGSDRLTDVALDANLLHQISKTALISAHAILIDESQKLDASAYVLGTRKSDTLTTARADVSFSLGDTWTPTVQLFKTQGSSDPALYTGPFGSPKSSGYVLELAYVPYGKASSPVWWVNWRAALQYTGYTEFDGAKAGASAADTLFLNFWVALAPLGSWVHR